MPKRTEPGIQSRYSHCRPAACSDPYYLYCIHGRRQRTRRILCRNRFHDACRSTHCCSAYFFPETADEMYFMWCRCPAADFIFVNAMNGGGEFFFLSVPTVFGLSVVFFPLVIREMTLPPVLSDKKALIIMIWDTLWLYLTIFTISYRSGLGSLKTGCIVATVLMIGVWLFFLIIRYLPVNGFIKGGLCTLLCSIWITFSNDVCSYLLYDTRQLTIRHANFSTWTTDLNVNANVYVILLVAGILISALLIGIGIVKRKIIPTKSIG